MSVQTKNGVHIPTTSECDAVLQQRTSSEQPYYFYECEGVIHCYCGQNISVSQYQEHLAGCTKAHEILVKMVRMS